MKRFTKVLLQAKSATNTQKTRMDPHHIQPMSGWFATFKLRSFCRKFACILRVSTFGPRRFQHTLVFNILKNMLVSSNTLKCGSCHQKLLGNSNKVLISLVRRKNVQPLKV